MLKKLLFSSAFLIFCPFLEASDTVSISREEIDEISSNLSSRLETEEKDRSLKYSSNISEVVKSHNEEVDKKELDGLVGRSLENQKYTTGLSIDGGGMRGLMPALWLDKIQKITNKPVHDLFDYIGGTSIGGILALGYTAPVEDGKPLSPSKFIQLFEERGEEIFPQRSRFNIFGKIYDKFREITHSRYDPGSLEKLLKEHFLDRNLGHSLSHVMITSLNSKTHDPFLFHSFNATHKPYELWKVGRATSAAPTFFPSYSLDKGIDLIDGGMYYNNPTSLLMRSMYDDALNKDEYLLPAEVIMVSLGTGESPVNTIANNAGWANGAKPIIDTLMNTSSRAIHQSMDQLFPKGQYLRVNPVLAKDMALDAASSDDIKILKDTAESQYDALENFFTGDDSKFRTLLEKKD